jgi:hypothetical protein
MPSEVGKHAVGATGADEVELGGAVHLGLASGPVIAVREMVEVAVARRPVGVVVEGTALEERDEVIGDLWAEPLDLDSAHDATIKSFSSRG